MTLWLLPKKTFECKVVFPWECMEVWWSKVIDVTVTGGNSLWIPAEIMQSWINLCKWISYPANWIWDRMTFWGTATLSWSFTWDTSSKNCVVNNLFGSSASRCVETSKSHWVTWLWRYTFRKFWWSDKASLGELQQMVKMWQSEANWKGKHLWFNLHSPFHLTPNTPLFRFLQSTKIIKKGSKNRI